MIPSKDITRWFEQDKNFRIQLTDIKPLRTLHVSNLIVTNCYNKRTLCNNRSMLNRPTVIMPHQY